MSDLELRGVHKGYEGQPVLVDLDLVVASESLTAILGPSGSGKTTLLRLVAGFDRVDEGEIRIGGSVVDDGRRRQPPERRRLGYVPQEGALFPHLSVAGNVGFGLSRGPNRTRRVDELLELVGLSGLQRRYPDQLSGGQQQRVALARALAVDPELVLLDEPFSSLDATLRVSLRSDVRDILRRAGATAVLVTHDQDEALSLADRVAVLRRGRVVQDATPHQLYTEPADLELARFVGEANVLAAAIAGGHADTALGRVDIGGTEPAAAAETDPAELTDLGVRSGPAPTGRGDQVVLRPEQIEVHTGDPSRGRPGKVVRSDFHGHYSIVWVAVTETRAGQATTTEIAVRHEDLAPLPVDAAVTVSIRGGAKAWRTRSSDG